MIRLLSERRTFTRKPALLLLLLLLQKKIQTFECWGRCFPTFGGGGLCPQIPETAPRYRFLAAHLSLTMF